MTGPAGPAGPRTAGWPFRRSLASRVILLTTLAVGVTVAMVAVGAYFTARVQMQDSLDDSLVERAESASRVSSVSGIRVPQLWSMGASDLRVAVVTADRRARVLDGGPTMELGEPEIAVARGDDDVSIRTVVISSERHRVAAVPLQADGLALVLAEPLSDQDRVLARLGWVTIAFGVLGVFVAGLAGWAVARNGLRPVRNLTTSVEEIAQTEDLRALPVEGDDEIARLAAAFNQMLTALDASRVRQRQLVADASHELRTPLTSLRTNIDLLTMSLDDDRLPAQARADLLEDIRAQAEELTGLIGDLTELARDEPARAQVETLDLADIVAHAAERVRRRAPGVVIEVFTRSWWVVGEAWALERAVTNLLDNAAKWSPEGGTVTARLSDGVLTIDDQGPGIEEADRVRIFDRFWRSDDSRTLPGSGLGLAIVRQVADRHSGTVQAMENSAGGARLVLRLPGRETE
ncbi:HAMP domain-containing histidine kinase [Nocardioides panacisoli]|uniref:HAMP domain-containing sensor histidine kinase n=1 Tax=Nocardioides panacisoli TaxID=627624 RepID=UPI001C62D326|nr:HAMP domain-containing sensor histidine kinase [Nocardioides panacisoli]QYJ03161.1 HAMP domain-containing histidine kinase [Nocardioides panacisoli]